MKLIDLLVQELPKRGGWPGGVVHAWCDREGEIRFRNGGCRPDFYPSSKVDLECRIPHSDYEDDVAYIVTRKQYEAALAASQHPSWNGEGIPPEGSECEVKSGKDLWTLCKVVHSSSAGVAFIYLEEPSGESSSKYIGVIDCIPREHAGSYFRPIRTEADRKIDEAAAALTFVLTSLPRDQHVTEWSSAIVEKIASGEIPGIRLE